MIVAVTAWRGAGASTAALLLAMELAGGPDGAWLVEADPAGGSLAGRLDLPPGTAGSLERVAFPSTRTTAVAAFTDAAAIRAGAAPAAGNLRIITSPVDPFRAHACHQPRLPWVPALADLGAPVVVDVGRMRGGAPTWPVLLAADAVVLVTSPEVADVVGTHEWLAASGRVAPADPGLSPGATTVVAVAQPTGVAFPRTSLATEFAGSWGGWLPWEPVTVDAVHRGATSADRRLRRSALLAAVQHLATHLERSVR
ncbi:MAG: hypothetical protein R2694_18360 [Ilumatobacteraceae bacterium]